MTQTDSTLILRSSLTLSASLLEAVDEESALRAMMRAGCDVLGADGCMFMPFDEFSRDFLPLEFGTVPSFDAERLTNPAVRQRCKVCETRFAGNECQLLVGASAESHIECFPLRLRGREAGLFSFVFSQPIHLDALQEAFLAEGLRLLVIALEGFQRGHVARSMQYSAPPSTLADEIRSLLPEIEYHAILGERTRIAREIHDGLAQTLAFLKIEIGRADSILKQGETERAQKILKDAYRTLEDAYLDARQAIENLRRVPGNMSEWMRQSAVDFGEIAGLPVQLDLRLEVDFPPNIQVQLIRIVQEALTNVRKHAQARNVRVSAWQDGEDAWVEVADDGRGFAPAEVTANRFGLRGMRERAEAVGAEFQVISHPGQGAVIRLRIPLRVGVKS